MAGTIDMKVMRYINLFSRISHVQTKNCFEYNNQLIFAVPKTSVSKAIGKGAENIRKMRETIGRRIRVLAMPEAEDERGIITFVTELISPVETNKIDLSENTLTITANRQSKAVIIGRNRTREKELQEILKNNFRIPTLRIV